MQMNSNKHGPSSLLIGKAVAPMLSNRCWHPVFMHIFTLLTLICVSPVSAGSFSKMTRLIEVFTDAGLQQKSVRMRGWTYLLTRWPPNESLDYALVAGQFMFSKRGKRRSTHSSAASLFLLSCAHEHPRVSVCAHPPTFACSQWQIFTGWTKPMSTCVHAYTCAEGLTHCCGFGNI